AEAMQPIRVAQIASPTLKTNELLGISQATKKWAEAMQPIRVAQIASLARLRPQLDALNATQILAATSWPAVALAEPAPTLASDPAIVPGTTTLTETGSVIAIVAWYRSLSPKKRRVVSDAFLALVAATAGLISAATDSRSLVLVANGLAVALALMRLFDTLNE